MFGVPALTRSMADAGYLVHCWSVAATTVEPFLSFFFSASLRPAGFLPLISKATNGHGVVHSADDALISARDVSLRRISTIRSTTGAAVAWVPARAGRHWRRAGRRW